MIDRQIKIRLCTDYSYGACSFYRTWGAIPKLSKLNEKIVVSGINDIDWCALSDTDILYMERPYKDEYLLAAQMAKSFNVKLWIDWDDNVLDVPPDNPTIDIFGKRHNINNIEQILKLADIVTVATGALREKYKKYNRNVHVIENAFNDYNYALNYSLSGKNVICWRGSKTHRRDIMTVKDEIIAVSEKRNSEWFFFGDSPWYVYENVKNAVVRKEYPILLYFEEIKAQSPSIFIVPLVDNDFNRCKSNCSWIEAIYAGAVVLAPDLPEFRKPGITNYKNPYEFHNMLIELIDNPKLREDNYGKSFDYIRDNLYLSSINKKRLEVIEKVI